MARAFTSYFKMGYKHRKMLIKFLKHIYSFFKKQPSISENKPHLRFMKTNPTYQKYEIGMGTYGFPKIYDWGNSNNLKIGKYCSIGDNVSILLAGEHRSDWVSTYPFYSFDLDNSVKTDQKTKGQVSIGNDVWIGNNVLILSGVSLADGVIVGAGSVVTKNVEPFQIVAGNPAKPIKKRFTDTQISALLKITWWNWTEEKVKERKDDIMSDNIDDFIKKYG